MSAPMNADAEGTVVALPTTGRWLFRGIGASSLESAVERFKAFATAHPDLEPTLRCERYGNDRRHYVLDVWLRDNPRRET